MLSFQVALGCVESLSALLLLALLWVALALISGCRPLALLLRALLVVPFCISALPLVFTGSGPEVPLLGGWVAHGSGVHRWLQLVLRAWLGLAATLWLLQCLGREPLLRGLAGLGCPKLLLLVVSLALRYLEVLAGELGRMQVARQSRGCGPVDPGWRWRARSVGQLAGALLVRSQHRSTRVSRAMLSRGGILPPGRAQRPGAGTLLLWLLNYCVLGVVGLWL